jgi:outer membrane protein assembly factor BamB
VDKRAVAGFVVAAVLASTGAGATRAVDASGGSSAHRAATVPCGSARKATATAVNLGGTRRWSVRLRPDSDGGNEPAVATASTVYADEGGAVTAIVVATGRTLWRAALGEQIYGEWVIGPTLVVGVNQVATSSRIVGLTASTGAVQWRYRPGGGGLIGDPLPGGDGLVFETQSPARLVDLDAHDGRVRWARPQGQFGQPVVGDGVVAVAPAGTLYGFDLETGRQRWAVTHVGTMAELAYDEGTVLVGSQETGSTPLAGYTITSGARRYTLPFPADYATPVVATAAGFVLPQQYPVDKGGLTLLNPVTGAVRWDDTTSTASSQSDPTLSGAYLFTVEDLPQHQPPYLQARAVATGRLVFGEAVPASEYIASLVPAADGDVLATGLGPANSGLLELVGPHGIVWRYLLPQAAQAPAIALGDDGAFAQSEDLGCATW